MIVVDTNLVANLLLGGTGEAVARAVLHRDHEWVAPLLWRSEFRNVLAGQVRRRNITFTDAERAAAHAEKLLSGREHVVRSPDVLRWVARSKLSAYDCEFVALAEHLKLPLVTTDREILDSCPSIATTPTAFADRE